MIPFLDIYTLLAVILRALALVFEALMIGGVIFRFVSVPEDCEHRLNASLTRMIRVSAALLALTAFVYLSINSALLMLSTNLRWRDLCGASFFVWGAVVIVGAGVCGACAQATRARALCSGGCILALVAAVMTSHSAARLDHRAILIGLTAAHHLAGAAWIGGLPYLLLALTRTSDPSACKTVLRRFSSTATISVVVVLVAGVTMGGIYVGSAAALAGTSYGIMLLSKAILTSCILAFGWVNLKTVRATRTGAEPSLLLLRRSAEAEAGLGVTVILAAASLTSIPPAIDVQADRVRAGEIHDQMMPRMQTPRFAELSPATPLVGMQLVSGVSVPGLGERKDTPADIAWSEYNHHWAGLVMLAVGFLSMLARRWRWARAWPLVFLGLALFLLIRARL